MSNRRQPLFADENPFSTVATKPGAIEFRFSGDTNAATLVDQLRRDEWRGEIVGPHGSGKSTLLQSLKPAMVLAGRQLVEFVVTPKNRQIAFSSGETSSWTSSTQVIVEGYESLRIRDRMALTRVCRSKQAGLLITCHESQGLPTLYETSITLDLATELVDRLLPDGCNFITHADVEAAFARHGQNLRELLFEMYDLYEQRRPPPGSA